MKIISSKYEKENGDEQQDRPKIHDVIAKKTHDAEFSFRGDLKVQRYSKLSARKSDKNYSCFKLPGDKVQHYSGSDMPGLEEVLEDKEEYLQSNSQSASNLNKAVDLDSLG